MDRIYLDYGSASPVDPRVVAQMTPYFTHLIGNPSASHSAASEAKELIEKARSQVAALIGADKDRYVVFTGGATEANNLAVIGAAQRGVKKGNKVILSEIEHMSVINPARSLAKQGFELIHVPVDQYGLIDLDRLAREADEKTVLISVMYANSEIGTIEPVREIARIAHRAGAVFHADATAAAGKVEISVAADEIDLLTVSSNDLYGPQGVGALYAGPRAKIQPLILGGGQESGMRSGTENLAGIVGMGRAAEIARTEMAQESERLMTLRNRLIEGVLQSIKDAHLTGHPRIRLPHHASFRFDYVEGESMILMLDMKGILASTGSACSSKTLKASHVLTALGLEHEQAHGSLLLTLGRWSKPEDINALLSELPPIVARLREISPLTRQKTA